MACLSVRYIVPVLLSSVLLVAQDHVDPKNQHERIMAVVPIIGAGTYADPKRPMFAPGPKDERAVDGILSFEWQPSDDGQYAVVEFVALDRKPLEAILAHPRVVKAFEKGKVKREDVERELRTFRKDFSGKAGLKGDSK